MMSTYLKPWAERPRDDHSGRRAPGKASPSRWVAMTLAAALAAGGAAATVVTPAQAAQAEEAPSFANEYLDGVSGPVPTTSVDLAGTWDFEIVKETVCVDTIPFYPIGPVACTSTDSGIHTTIQVPGGGWFKQGFTEVSEAIYSRQITVPKVHGPQQVTKIHFGAINHEATLAVDGKVVATNMTAFTDSEFDLTGFVTPGKTHTITVDVKGRSAFVGDDGRYTVPEAASWSKELPQGIFRSATLDVYPALSIQDTFVETSVEDETVTITAWIHNGGKTPSTGQLDGAFSSASDAGFAYPQVPKATVVKVAPGTTEKVTIGPLEWLEGSDSYWWPNVPYQEGYRAQLHGIDLKLKTGSQTAESFVRFGFRELEQVGDGFELNGAPINFRGDSLQGADYDSIDYYGKTDAFDTLPGFLAPSDANGGWPQAVDNYQRLNFNSVRIHQEPATPYMLDVADEMGLMLMGESAIRGSNGRENFITGRDNMLSHLRDLVVRDRNHASILRWSQSNEPNKSNSFVESPGWGYDFDLALYNTVMAEDTTRPISTDKARSDRGAFAYPDLDFPNYTAWCHYENQDANGFTEDVCDGYPYSGKPHGSGEHIWSQDYTPRGNTYFATTTERMRQKGAGDIRPYTLLSFWASFIPGVRTTDLTLEPVPGVYPAPAHPRFGEDNLPDPWSNKQIQLVHRAFSPLLVVDGDYWNANKLSDQNGAWPVAPVTLPLNAEVTRTLSVFNDTLDSDQVSVEWELRQGSSAGAVVDSGSLDLAIPVGTDVDEDITFTTPGTSGDLYLVLTSSTPEHEEIFSDAATRFITE